MAFNILKTDGTPLLDGVGDPVVIPSNTIIPAGPVGGALDLTLFGKGKRDYGKDWNENFVRLLENFANVTEPDFPQEGQQWFDKSGSPPSNTIRYRVGSIWETTASQQYVDDQIAAFLSIGVPTGMTVPYAGTGAAPTGWVLCDGTSYTTAGQADLFAVIGYTYGGAGPNFNVPDFRGRFPLGQNTSGSGVNRINRTQAQNIGQVSGDENVTLTTAQMPVHTHTASTGTDGAHSHTGATTNTTGSHTHTAEYSSTAGLEGGGPWVASQLPGAGTFETTSSAGSHSHTVTVPSSGSTHSHSVTVNNEGSGNSHDNTPPFLTVQYIIKT